MDQQFLSELLTFSGTALLGYVVTRAAKELMRLAARTRRPRRRLAYKSHSLDSTLHDRFAPRDSDVFVVAAYEESGATWLQQIVAMLIFDGEDPPAPLSELSPWLDFAALDHSAALARLEQQTHRRFVRSHLPPSAIGIRPGAKYVYIACDGRDAFMAFCHHYEHATDAWYALLNDRPGRIGAPLPRWADGCKSPAALFDEWISKGWETHAWESDGWPLWSLFHSVASWWSWRHLPNVLLVHARSLEQDLPRELRRIADFLGVEVEESRWGELLRKCAYEHVRQLGDKVAPLPATLWAHSGSGHLLLDHGGRGQWRQALSDAQLRKYDEIVAQMLTPECARWLETGELPEGVPSSPQ